LESGVGSGGEGRKGSAGKGRLTKQKLKRVGTAEKGGGKRGPKNLCVG